MRIATFNVNSVRSRINGVLEWLLRHSPDVLCLQETKVEDKYFPVEPFKNAGYQVIFRGEKSYNGVALISKIKPLDPIFGFDDGRRPDATRLIHARIGPVHVVNTYVPQGRDIEHEIYQYKLQWFKRLRKWFESNFTPATPLIWVGDMNVAPEARDVHNPERHRKHVCFHKSVRDAFSKTVDWGFVDVFRKHHQESGHYTYFDYRTANAIQRGIGWRVDHILATRICADKCTRCVIDVEPRMEPKPSDHTVLTADFRL